MIYPYSVYPVRTKSGEQWIAESDILKGCVGQGSDHRAATRELERNEMFWLQTAKEMMVEIPERIVKDI